MPARSEGASKLRTLRYSAVAIASAMLVEAVLGLVVDSLAILSDGLHASLDVITTIMLFMATKEALKPPDEEHMYGHEKFEAIGGLIAGIILVGVAVLILYEAAVRLMVGVQVNEGLELAGFLAIGYTLCVDLFRVTIFRGAGQSQSTSVKAGFYDAISDLGSTIIALIGFGLATLGFYYGDSVASIFLGLMLIFLSARLARASIMELSDTASKELVQKIRNVVDAYEEIMNCRDMKARRAGSKIFVECTIQVSRVMSLEEAHALASDIEEHLVKMFGSVDASIHIEPAEEETRMEHRVEKLATVEGVREVHDIVTVYASGKLYITLHAYVDPKLSVEEAHEIAEKIEKRMHANIKPLEDVTVHVEPHNAETSRTEIDENEMKRLIDELGRKVRTSLRLKRTVTYSAEGKRYINVDCCFTKHVPLKEAHEIASQVEKEISEYFADAAVTVHIEPECE
ncbi:MAG: cation diffusion facilitator family transporter [Candidatus Bathyarchaeia archaeon]|nr:cation diffusion facilitator family transporter [Candidatus Bathyarchaeia archaeon]